MRLLRRMHPPGTSPGTITVPVDVDVPPSATLTRFTADAVDQIEITASSALAMERRPDELWWLDVVGFDAALIADLGSRFEIPSLVLEDIVNVGQRPKVEEYDSCIFLVADLVHRPTVDGRITVEQVSLVLLDQVVISFRERPSDVFDPIRRRLESGKGRIRTGGVDYLTYALLDVIVDRYLPVLDAVGQRIEAIEGAMVEDGEPHSELLATLHGLRRDLVLVRRGAWPQRDAVARLLRAEEELVNDDVRIFLRDVADHLALIVDMVESYREMVTGLMELYLSSVSNRMNEVMKVLTIIATIFIPLSFIAGVYGMNFDPSAGPYSMPELAWRWGYPAVLLVMAAVAGGLLVYFRTKKWL